jgi:ABC-type nitrate/sulfonate/bicarbonate transport system substrate-binding protein
MLRWKFLSVMLLLIVLTYLSRVEARMVVGVSTVNVAFLPIYLTQDKGFFKDEGIGCAGSDVQCRCYQFAGHDWW